MACESESNDDDILLTRWCSGCRSELKEPYIRCAECVNATCTLCLKCFAKGFESETHQSDHAFELLKNDFQLWDDEKWTAGDELKLLEAIEDNGLGNWGYIAKCLPKKTAKQCEQHFLKFYLELIGDSFTGKRIHEEMDEPPVPIPYKVCDNPPRPAMDSQRYADMAGYSASRADFVTEYDNYAELSIKEIEFHPQETEIEQELKMAMVDMYNDRLRERARRKTIIARYGLIDIWRLAFLWQNFESYLGKGTVNTLRAVTRLLPPQEFHKFIEMIRYEIEQLEKIKHLNEFRQAGITKLASIRIYKKLKKRREENIIKRSNLDSIIHTGFNMKTTRLGSNEANGKLVVPNTPFPTSSRRSAAPIDVTGLPGYSKLSEKERVLCSTLRLIPDDFIKYKNLLINENCRTGYLPLKIARDLIKIDVNKTRKLYDFLVNEGLIGTKSE